MVGEDDSSGNGKIWCPVDRENVFEEKCKGCPFIGCPKHRLRKKGEEKASEEDSQKVEGSDSSLEDFGPSG